MLLPPALAVVDPGIRVRRAVRRCVCVVAAACRAAVDVRVRAGGFRRRSAVDVGRVGLHPALAVL